ncbi:autotransporter outer membrane beta-barrel domain-containing protein [Achromobacter xylosoxidans]|uniref:autotransporter outer membrane beta-barrel domain-containing protein n=1 Tax=Alcaligenes xylosoxydans xylosoxydans TaxID=85698 RepID=UPI001F065B63|nr:autotransporter outer membrane beta-barrel domain-containing protein [Achromobacter xylosoxidans]MCH1984803.1 autotransporter outer membrane beta-barrel domain-containing protein [Achromobacter xylosoxidans]MCH4584470.1 autotransporter outer membrane beta-barrel domain-containing protein [Achromobacter xylosoxidans]
MRILSARIAKNIEKNMSRFPLNPLTRHCLLAFTAYGGLISCAVAGQSPWRSTDGSTMVVDSSYSSSTAGDYPLFVSGEGGRLVTYTEGLVFETTGNGNHAAFARDGGAIDLVGANLSTTGHAAHGLRLHNASAVITGGNITVSGSQGSGVVAEMGSSVSLHNVNITVEGSSASGVQITDGALTVTDTTIAANGRSSSGMRIGSEDGKGMATAVLRNVTIVSGNGSVGAGLYLGNSDVVGDQIDISMKGGNTGVEISNPSTAFGKLTLTNSTIATEDGDGISIIRGSVTLVNTDITTTGDGYALNVNGNADVTVDGGTFTTHADSRDAIWLASKNTKADVKNATFTTYGARSHAFNAISGVATLSNTALNTSGDGSYGLYTDNKASGENLVITTGGAKGIGAFAARGGTIDLRNSKITTSGTASVGLQAYAGSTVNGQGLLVATSGEAGHGMLARDGTLNVSSSDIRTTGKDAAGLYVGGSAGGSGSQVTLNGVYVESAAGPAIKTTGYSANVALTNGTRMVGGNGVLLQDSVNVAGTPSVVAITADNQVVLRGDILAATENDVTVALSGNSLLGGAIQGVDGLTLDGGSGWTMTGDSKFGHLQSDGLVQFGASAGGFSTLSVATLDGNGGFVMGSDIAALQGDLIAVSGAATGDHMLYISNTGKEPVANADELTVVTTGGGGATFSAYGGAVDAGTYKYELTQRGDDWVLARKLDERGAPEITPTTATALALFNAAPTAWYGEMTTLRTRMGDMRQGKQNGGAWVRALGSQQNVNERAGVGYKQNQAGVSLGADVVHDITNGKLVTGLFTGYSRSDLNFDHGSAGAIDSVFIGGYGTWLMDSGWFVDTVAKFNRFDNKSKVRMSNGERADGSYDAPAFGLSVEVGRHIGLGDNWFVEPSAQLASVWVKGGSYTYSNDLKAESDSTSSHQAALHGLVGKTFELKNGATLQPWVRASVVQEFASSNAVSINDNRFNNDMSGARAELGAGVSAQATKNLQVYADLRYAKGSKIEMPWAGGIGLRFTW